MTPIPPGATGRTLGFGARIGRYHVVRRLGVGGMAEVYLAVARGPRGFEKRVALKLLHPYAAHDADRVAELFREARIVATLDHPNIAQVLDVGLDDGESYLAMEYIRGRDVRDLLAAQGRGNPLPLDCALQIVIETAQGLHHAHELRDAQGRPLRVVHRDVSPSNVLVSYQGAVKVVDFGLVKIDTSSVATSSGVLKGKFGYMAPEQARGATVDRRCDVYALGVLLYELTLGRRAFTGINVFEMMNRVFEGAVASPSEIDPAYPASLERIVRKAMALDPDERFQTADDLQRALQHFARRAEVFPSASTLAALMARSFEEASRAEPSLSALMDDPEGSARIAEHAGPDSGSDPTVRVSNPKGHGRLRVWGVAAGVGLTAGLGGWWVGGGALQSTAPASTVSSPPEAAAARDFDDPPTIEDTTEAQAASRVGAPTSRVSTEGAEPRSAPKASPDLAPETVSETVSATADADRTTAGRDAESSGKNRRRRRRAKPADPTKPRASRSQPSPAPEPESPLDGMYPPSLP